LIAEVGQVASCLFDADGFLGGNGFAVILTANALIFDDERSASSGTRGAVDSFASAADRKPTISESKVCSFSFGGSVASTIGVRLARSIPGSTTLVSLIKLFS